MQIFLEAMDVWLFRNGRPFDALSDHRAESLFPPYPSVMQGVIRSHHLVVKSVDLRDPQQIESTVGTTDDYRDLRLRGPFLARRENSQIVRYLPVPAHAAPTKDGYIALTPQEPPKTVRTNAPTPMLLWPKGEPQKSDFGQWLPEHQLRSLLTEPGTSLSATGSSLSATGLSDDKLFARESRLGIARNERRTTEEGALYEVEFIRPQEDTGLLVEVEGYDGWPSQGVMRIGGEGRAARFEQVTNVSSRPTPATLLPPRFLVYFATPTYFAHGWRPESWAKFFDGEVKLQAAALNRFHSLGGFDWAKNPRDPTAHKPARRYVPAGAVYFFTAEDEVRLKSNLTQNAITDLGAEIGFGQILIGEW
jgi:CRISPR-associated protein Cmr3